ncbi:MAG: phosphoribosylglycinamide formyltransferase [Peptococcaceae bacterium]|jgi:phosphoribosylglycinamide formyltransferase-1|nr:phosphoribosylglycinamide formyltransferase [Peptococcaceae bacterium]
MLNIVILVSGRGSNFMSIHSAIKSGRLDGKITGVISSKENAPALAYAKGEGIPAFWLNPQAGDGRLGYEERLLRTITELGSDCLALAGYLLLLSGNFIRRYGKPILNIHPALLPAFPGLTAQRDAVAYGVKYSGCTVHFVDAGMDSGPIIAQAVVPVLETDQEDSLAARILATEHQLYPEVLALMAEGRIHLTGRKVTIDEA